MSIMSVGFGLWPNKVVKGVGAVKTVGNELKELGVKERVIIFTDETLKTLPMVTELVELLKKDGFSVSVFSGISPNPTEEQVMNAVEMMKDGKPEAVVAIGGGSSIDAAKAANVTYTHGGYVGDYSIEIGGITKIGPKVLPLVAIPTTAGTGTEVTMVSVITDTKRHVKYGVLSPFIVPNVSILDPELTVSLPPAATAYTGIDALTHAIESYVSVVDFEAANGAALQAIRMISKNLRKAVKDGKDINARAAMLEASMMAGFAFNVNGLGLCHQTAHQLSAQFGIPHGLANAIMLPHTMRFNMDACYQKYADIAMFMGADVHDLPVEKAAEKSVELVEQLISDLGIPRYLDDVNVTKDKVPAMVKEAVRDNSGMNNPKKTTKEECEKVYLNAFRN